MEPDWANLDALALNFVLDNLIERIDHVWFGAVCKNWHSVAKLYHKDHKFRSKVLPMLMMPIERDNIIKRNLYSILAKRMYPAQFPLASDKMCCGFSHGWLAITTRGSSNVITLLNLFKNVAPISLPPFKSRCGIYNYKVTLSADPTTNPNDYVVATIKCDIGRGLTYIKAGEQTWSYLNTPPNYGSVTDITFYKGMLYAVNKWKRILSFDLSRSYYPMIRNGIPYSDFGRNSVGTWTYLVKSLEGDLWMVTRSSFNFHVYNLVLDTDTNVDMRMSKIDSLGDNVLFLGDSDSISVPVSYFSCLQKDSIYYIEDGNNGKRYFYPTVPISYHLGIYNVNDESFAYHYLYNTSLRWMPVPFWVLPSFQWD